MKLYHFTSEYHLLQILKDTALTKGDVPLSPTHGINAVWFTIDPNRYHQLWIRGSAVDKTKVRVEVRINRKDPNLVKWTDFAKKHLAKAWFETLDKVVGYRSNDWYIYLKTFPLPPETHIDIEGKVPYNYRRKGEI